MTPRFVLTLGLLPCAAALSGCVAAAIPLVAGGALARSATDGEPGPRVTVDASASASARPDARIAAQSADFAPSKKVQAASQAPASAGFRATFSSSPAIDEFIRYSESRARAFAIGGEPVPSAVLREPALLDGKRLSCEADKDRPASVLIDLDPGEAMFGESSPLPLASAAQNLAGLRSQGVTIAWISANSAAHADIIRQALAQFGLDPAGTDPLLLMRYPADRKQTRRTEFGEKSCIIAIVGDERRDFDELYDYLTNPDAALALEPLFNQGWFLIGNVVPFGDNDPGQETQAATQGEAPFQTREEQDR